MMNNMNRYKQYQMNPEKLVFPKKLTCQSKGLSVTHQNKISEILSCDLFDENQGFLRFENLKSMNDETYQLELSEKNIILKYGNYSGFLYGLLAIKTLMNDQSVHCGVITDYPSLKIRGVLLDISRNKIPTMDTLKGLIEKLFLFRINHLELYIEGFSFYDPSYPDAPYQNPLTLQEFISLQDYAATYGIDLVPNMNGLGHMTDWLSLAQFKALSEKEDGFEQWGHHFAPSTLNPLDPKSLDFVNRLYLPLLKNSKSKFFHMNLDEPFEIGQGKSKNVCDSIGKENVYLRYVNQLKQQVKSYQKQPLIWADVIFSHPDSIQSLEDDIIYCDWGYDYPYPFEEHAIKLEENNLNFILCPGTSSWNSICSRKRDMIETTKKACLASYQHRGLGIITTDWGDYGHMQPLLFSEMGFAYAGFLSWNTNYLEQNLLSDMVALGYHEEELSLIDRASQYSLLEPRYEYNSTMTFYAFLFVDPDMSHPVEARYQFLKSRLSTDFKKTDYEKINKLMTALLREEASLSKRNLEIEYALRLTKTLAYLRYAIPNEIQFENWVKSELQIISNLFQQTWHQKNRYSGFNQSNSRLNSLIEIVDYILM